MVSPELTHNERIAIGCRYYGLYMLGYYDPVDERCCMDDMRVPWLHEQLSEDQREYLKRVMELKRTHVN